MPENRPQGRKTSVSGKSTGVYRRGQGQGTGPVGGANSHPQNRPSSSRGSGSRAARAGGGGGLILILLVLAYFIFGKGGGLGSLLGGTGSSGGSSGVDLGSLLNQGSSASVGSYETVAQSPYANLFANAGTGESAAQVNTGTVDTNVAAEARDKYTRILGNQQDTVTIMVYMCGTDLESRSGMATKDLSEMARATIGENVNVVVYTGGCSRWNNNIVSASKNQIYEVQSGGLKRIVEDAGSEAMTKPETLAGFIQFCAKNYPANRNMLIFWDHGGGSVSGYGYDEKNKAAGTLDLAELQAELRAGLKGAKYANGKKARFDFIGFDACLMATVETALMAEEFADYMIASEETEPGIGWYYTEWLTALGENPSIDTLDLGKIICDTFVSECAKQAAGQKTTLSIVDLAELKHKMPDALRDFSTSVTGMVKNGNYQTVSTARNGAREFAASTQIDQVDLSDLATKIGGTEATNLAKVIGSAVKYNRATFNGAYGLSIYFPYRKAANVSKAVKINSDMKEEENNEPIVDSSYSECIRAFASMAGGGAYVASGSSGYNTAATTLSGGGYGSMDAISSLLGMFLGGDGRDLSGVLDETEMVTYLTDNTLRDADLTVRNVNGQYTLTLPQEKWDLVTAAAVNLFYYDAAHNGYVDLGYDNMYTRQDNTLICDDAGAWITLNGKIVAYYVETADQNEAYGYIPVEINGLRYELTTYYDGDAFRVVGARRVYKDETEAIAKTEEALEFPITIQPIFDFYDSNYEYQDSFRYGDAIAVSSPADLKVEEMAFTDPENLFYSYRLTDIYQQRWWTNTYKIK